jgi:hypothetical protein
VVSDATLERVTKTLLYAGIAVLAVADVAWSIIEHSQGWRGGQFSRGLTRYRPGYNAKTGQLGGPPAEGLHSLLNTVVFLAIAFLLLDWAKSQ